jgi:hypothetical protein
MRHSMRCVLYMLAAFALRRRNVGRRNLRTSPANPNRPNSARLRFGSYTAAAFRATIRARLASASSALLDSWACPSIAHI